MNIDFPNYPTEYLSNQELRGAYAKARAYAIFYMEESEIENDHDLTSAIATANAHDMNLELTSDEYLQLSLREVSYAEGLLKQNSDFRSSLEQIRQTLSDEQSTG